MIDITHKSNTLRVATAQAVVKVSTPDTIAAIRNNTVPKGDVFAMSKAAGLLGVKKTAELLPDCHPMPIEYTGIEYSIDGLEITISVTIKTIYKTGVEVEAMHGASIVALNMYDMLKPIDKGIEIHHIKLLEKKGGISSYPTADVSHLKAGIVVCSDSIFAGNGTDTSGQIIQERLLNFGVAQADVQIIPDDFEMVKIRERKRKQVIVFKDPQKKINYKLSDHITTHTMRRTAITTMLNLGMPEHIVRKISGHAANSKEFFRYVQMSQSVIDFELDKIFEKIRKIKETEKDKSEDMIV